jgi:hypothetical protein
MNSDEIKEILDYVNRKYSENIPRPVRFVVRRKAKMIEKFNVNEMPETLRNCTVEHYIAIIKEGLKQGTFKL